MDEEDFQAVKVSRLISKCISVRCCGVQGSLVDNQSVEDKFRMAVGKLRRVELASKNT